MSLVDKLKSIIAEKLEVDIEKVVPEASFINDLGADSLKIVELMMTLEDEFDIEISDEEAEKLVTVEDAVGYLEKIL
ncbi:MAG: acyl carrier protein [Deltaproteobacteria bacterium]|nr:MAG: acyl carrier protein [Deltaproteobacteria bacterium]